MLTDEWIRETCLALPGSDELFKEEWNSTLYRIGGKYYAMRGTNKEGEQILTLKCDPLLADEYRERYEQIVPGYYSNKAHWNSILLERGGLEAEFVAGMIRHAYERVRSGLTKKVRDTLPEA
ncbi:MmcQ/YjbR family DNA-binding protein [Saccharibacillus sp. CPCC 101409]|uniref:MmcQ/YjbR family DNA-binding protein n=1 Tax=Saccharibacillus sp. CPCC 101409 TaxID=3058041 RepID=UPI0026731A2A|nr:MmcQ/YjbR family DNA-binding protein [Saccharibacillus sp. CPCC 101409]MDO3412695.1 MmcQ/YjbR family DNA-binding protein [Saccharibacillus sp. CPCC 101409]